MIFLDVLSVLSLQKVYSFKHVDSFNLHTINLEEALEAAQRAVVLLAPLAGLRHRRPVLLHVGHVSAQRVGAEGTLGAGEVLLFFLIIIVVLDAVRAAIFLLDDFFAISPPHASPARASRTPLSRPKLAGKVDTEPSCPRIRRRGCAQSGNAMYRNNIIMPVR